MLNYLRIVSLYASPLRLARFVMPLETSMSHNRNLSLYICTNKWPAMRTSCVNTASMPSTAHFPFARLKSLRVMKIRKLNLSTGSSKCIAMHFLKFQRKNDEFTFSKSITKSTKPISVNQNLFDTLYKQLVNEPLKSQKNHPIFLVQGWIHPPKKAFFRTFYKIAYKGHTNIKKLTF